MRIDPADVMIESWPRTESSGMRTGWISSGVKITHKPTGVSVECNEHRSRHRNKAEAERMLSDKLEGAK